MKKFMMILVAAVLSMGISANSENRNGFDSHTDVVKAHDTDTYRIYCHSGEEAEVLVIGDGDTDLDVYVYDENGNLIEKDIRPGDDCYVNWTPKWSGYFKIKIKNWGNVSNRYVMMKD